MPGTEVLVNTGGVQGRGERLPLKDKVRVERRSPSRNLERSDSMSDVVIVNPFNGVVNTDSYSHVDGEVEIWR